MKTFLIVLSFWITGAAQAASYWINEEQKVIHFAPRATLEVVNQEVKADLDQWYLLSVELKYDYSSIQDQMNVLKRNFPGYRLQKVVMNKNGGIEVALPSLGIRETIDPSPGIEGPYFTLTRLLPKSAKKSLEKVLENLGTEVVVEGRYQANVPVEKLVEQVEISSQICEKFGKGEGSVLSAMRNYPIIVKAVEEAAKQVKSRELLLEQILSTCLELKRDAEISSFQELLQIPLKMAPMLGSFRVELKETKIETQVLPLQYEIRRGE
jgi:hypothetical protein